MPVFFLRKKYKTLDDILLVKEVATGNESAFRELLSRYQTGIFSFAVRIVGDNGAAEDIVQETFLRFYRASESLHPESNIRAFIFKIARNLCIDYLRKRRPELQDEDTDGSNSETPLDLIETKENKEMLLTAVLTLPERQKTAVLLRHTEDMTYHEIAAVMSVSVSGVESLLVRGRKTLRAMLVKG